MLELDAEEARVVGSLAEKALTTPQYYPLTLNALVNACNQSNNRDPVVSYDGPVVEAALSSLREKGAARLVHPGGGNRTTKYRHVLDEALGLDERELALVAVLLLRGPQTLNELRTRTERMGGFESADEVERDLDRLAARPEPLVAKLERRPGQKEARYATLLVSPDVERGDALARPAPTAPTAPARPVRTARPDAPRLAALTDDELTDEQRELIGGVRGAGTASNIFGTLARHPGLFRKWLPFGGKLLAGKLDPRLRELAILRTAWNTQAEYEWGQHVSIARAAGMSGDEIARVPEGPAAAAWSSLERAVLQAADELHLESCVRHDTWRELAAALDERELIEVVFVIGHYHLVAFALNSLGVQREPGVVGLPE